MNMGSRLGCGQFTSLCLFRKINIITITVSLVNTIYIYIYIYTLPVSWLSLEKIINWGFTLHPPCIQTRERDSPIEECQKTVNGTLKHMCSQNDLHMLQLFNVFVSISHWNFSNRPNYLPLPDKLWLPVTDMAIMSGGGNCIPAGWQTGVIWLYGSWSDHRRMTRKLRAAISFIS